MSDPQVPLGGKPDRRDALKGMAAGAALFPILPMLAPHAQAQHQHGTSASPAAAYTPTKIVGQQREWLSAVAERIIPRTDTPGAADVGVADQIDWFATRRAGLAEEIAAALARVNAAAGKPFPALSPSEQDAVLTRLSSNLESADGKAFTLLKNLTIDAYYSTQGGLQTELGWNANTYLPEFKGCTHDHQAAAANTPGIAATEVAE